MYGRSVQSRRVRVTLRRVNLIEWTTEKINRLTELVTSPEKFSESTIAEVLSKEFTDTFTRDAVHNKILRLNLRSLVTKPVTNIMPYYTKYQHLIEGDDALVKTLQLDDARPYVINIAKPKLKILYLGDPHIPFQVDEQIQEAVNRNKTANIVITNEILDCYSISRFNKKYNVPLEHEIDQAIRYLEYLSETFPLVLVFSGNHESRVRKEFQSSLNPALLFLAKCDIMEALTKPFENVVYVKTPFLQLNDAIFTHAEFFSRVDLKAVSSVYGFAREWQESLGLNDFRLVVQSHTHMLGSTYRGGSFKLMESGCLCNVPDYAVSGFYSKPQNNGYVVVTQFDGVTDFNLTREFVFPTQKYVPEWNPISRS